MSNVAKDRLWPNDPNILLRVAVLHVGQGNSAIVFAADGSTYKTMLVDTNLDSKWDGINVPGLVKDLLDGERLDVFYNTHPHNDHLCGIKELSDEVGIDAVWHSGHNPGPNHCERYGELQDLIKKVEKEGGEVIELTGSRSSSTFGEADYYVLSPADHVREEIGAEDPKVRYQRIHEHCAVIRIGSGDKWIMMPGDADREAWGQHIAKYHSAGGRTQSDVLLAAHHGSDSFFHDDPEQEPYMGGLEAIDPTHIIVSAPRSSESQWDHPEKAAMKKYQAQVDSKGGSIFHTGENRYSFICDLMRDGRIVISDDGGDLVKNYPYKPGSGGNGSGGNNESRSSSRPAVVRSSAPAVLGNDGRSG